jgi:cytochrome c-type biogenesis protein CcmH
MTAPALQLFLAFAADPWMGLVFAVLIVIALAFILPPLLQSREGPALTPVKEANIAVYRDQIRELERDRRNGIVSQEQYDQDRDELERRLLDDVSSSGTPSQPKAPAAGRKLGYVLGIGIPVLSISLYFAAPSLALSLDRLMAPKTSQSAPDAATTDESRAPFANGQMTPQQIEANVATLAKKLEQNPNDVDGWKMLARSYSEMQRYKDAAEAYSHAVQIVSNDADLWADYAFSVAMINGKEMSGKPMEFVKQALAIDPHNQKALLLAGNGAFAEKNYQQAIEYWQLLLQTLPADAKSAEVTAPLNEKIAEAKRLAKAAPTK